MQNSLPLSLFLSLSHSLLHQLFFSIQCFDHLSPRGFNPSAQYVCGDPPHYSNPLFTSVAKSLKMSPSLLHRLGKLLIVCTAWDELNLFLNSSDTYDLACEPCFAGKFSTILLFLHLNDITFSDAVNAGGRLAASFCSDPWDSGPEGRQPGRAPRAPAPRHVRAGQPGPVTVDEHDERRLADDEQVRNSKFKIYFSLPLLCTLPFDY